eukprot:767775-Hanusia_phi.AAC.5
MTLVCLKMIANAPEEAKLMVRRRMAKVQSGRHVLMLIELRTTTVSSIPWATWLKEDKEASALNFVLV